MKIQISQDDRGNTLIALNGTEVSQYISEFALSQKAGEVPILNITVPMVDGIEVELPDGIVIAQRESTE